VKKRTQFAGCAAGKQSEQRHGGQLRSIPFLGPLWLENPCGSAKFVTKNPKNAENFKEFHQKCVFRTSFIVSSVATHVRLCKTNPILPTLLGWCLLVLSRGQYEKRSQIPPIGVGAM
jgi:hypothetical protein